MSKISRPQMIINVLQTNLGEQFTAGKQAQMII